MANEDQSPYSNEEYTVGWVCALPVEFAAAKGMLDEEHGNPQMPPSKADSNSYLLGSIGKFKVAVACLPLDQLGAASAAICAKEMLFTIPKIRVGLLVGIGAGIPGVGDSPDIHLGDVVNDSWQPFAAAVAAAYAKELLGCVQPRDVDGEPPVKDIISKVHEEVVKIRNLATLERYQHIMEWLTPLNADDHQNRILKDRASGSGLWFLQSKEFIEWTSQTKQTLLCPGIPGAGKSMISAIVVEDLKFKYQEKPELQVCSLFCSYQSDPQESVLDLLLSLLRQLAVKGAYLHPTIQEMHKRHTEARTRPSMTEVKTELVKIAREYKDVFIVVDALDEYCSSSAEELNALLTTLFNLQKEAPINIMATSRPHSQKLSSFDRLAVRCVTKEIRAQDGDIEVYLNSRMTNADEEFAISHPDAQGDVLRAVTKSIDGMFLLARLHMDDLMPLITKASLRRALNNLPQGANKLTVTYDRTIAKIEADLGIGDRYELAIEILSWLAYSKRALYAKELQHALATRPEHSNLDEDFLPHLKTLGSLCAGLVEYDVYTGIIRLVHYTTKQYLVGHPILQEAEMKIAKTCITYLSFGSFSSGRSSRPEQYTLRQEQYPLHHYSAQNWATHASAALDSSSSEDTLEFFSRFLEKEYNVYAAGQAMLAHSVHGDEEPQFANWLDFIPRRLTKIHLVAYGGLAPMIAKYISSGNDMNARDSDGMTPLAYAAKYGHLEVVKLLLDSRSSFPDPADQYGKTPLLIAAFRGHGEIARLLIQHGANPHAKDDSGCSALCGAAETGDIELMQFFIDLGTSLAHAFRSGKIEAVQFLLSQGADPDVQDELGDTLLCDAAVSGDEDIVNELLRRGVRVNITGSSGFTPLHYAAKGGSVNIVRALINAGAYLNAQDSGLNSPLAYAIMHDFNEAALHLLRCGADPNLKDRNAEVALFHATRKSNVQMVVALLEHGADPNSLNKEHESPLFLAAGQTDTEILKCLRRFKADPRIENKYMQSPLFPAARNGNCSVIDELIDMGLDVNKTDDKGNTPLFYAAESGKEYAVQALLAKGADIQHRNLRQETALFSAARFGRISIVKLMLENNVDPDPKNIDMETPLLCAAKGLCPYFPRREDWDVAENSRVVSLLLDADADANPQRSLDSKSSTSENQVLAPLFYAVKGGYSELIKAFLKKGTQVYLSPRQVQIILEQAICLGHRNMLEMMLKEGPITFRERADIPALVIVAAKAGKKDILEFLMVEHSVSPETKSTALLFAMSNKEVETARFLLHHGVKATLLTGKAQSALHLAVFCGDLGLVNLLTKEGMKIDVKDKHGRTPLFYAVQRRELNIARTLLEAGANPNTTEAGYVEPLRYRDKVVSVPLKDLEARNTANCFGDTTPLFYAAAQVDPQDQFGEKPICWAAGKGYEAIVKILLDKGANPNQPDNPSQSPIFWALKLHEESLSQKISRGRGSGSWPNFGVGDMSAVVEVLLQRGADPNIVDEKGRPLISLLIDREVNSRNIVESLLGAGCNPNVKDRYGRTPLMGAVVRDMLEFASALLEDPRLDREATDSFGRTAIKEAISREKLWFLLLLDPQRYRSMVRVNGKEIPSDGKLVMFQQREGNSLYDTPRGTVDIHTELSFEDPWCSGIRDAFIMMVDNSDRGVCCDVCGARTPREAALNCTICNDGDFDLCVECKKWGAACFDDEHELVNRQPLQNRGQYFLMGSSLHGYD
ncbi:hypothetical protein TRIVIDRAFT_229138 [Aspergillus niger]|uniref:Uncharacterized protein n=1 Tax=Aspergillus niger TaxID=5061 RepID=A0A117E0D5_ASPNG|nr:hypothetical protein TRIVIDRAFT_229138 [Aspergillus niger]